MQRANRASSEVGESGAASFNLADRSNENQDVTPAKPGEKKLDRTGDSRFRTIAATEPDIRGIIEE